MIRDPVVATVPGARQDLLSLFRDRGYAGFPVVKQGSRKLVGLVVRQDLLENPDENQIALVMNPNPPTTYPEATIQEAARLVVERNLRIVPVVTGANDLVGILTPVEIIAALPRPRGHLAAHLRRRFVPMHRSTPTAVAWEILRSTRHTGAPVLDDDGRYVALVTDRDLLANVRVADRLVKSVSGLVGDGDAWTWEGLRGGPPKHHRMSRLEFPPGPIGQLGLPVGPTLTANAPLEEAARTVAPGGVHHLPVLDDEHRVVDAITDVDLVRAVLGEPGLRG